MLPCYAFIQLTALHYLTKATVELFIWAQNVISFIKSRYYTFDCLISRKNIKSLLLCRIYFLHSIFFYYLNG